MTAYFEFVAEPAGASRLVFESDLTREPAVAEKVLQVDQACSQMVSAVIVEDTGLSSSQAELLASGLLGLAEAAARRWLRDCVESPDTSISLEEAAARYRLTLDELTEWQSYFARHGARGLRATFLQQYRHIRRP
jgi:hypothetical protein